MGRFLAAGTFLLLLTACDAPQRLAKLEKENQELRALLTKQQQATDLDLQAKCAAGAKTYFTDTWLASPKRKDEWVSGVLNYTSHYNRSLNKCFALIKHVSAEGAGRSAISMSLADAFEGTEIGSFIDSSREGQRRSSIVICSVAEKECRSFEEFLRETTPYMSK